MKVNPAFVSILIIATSLAIHTSVHLYLAITLALRHSELSSFHGPRTFSKMSPLVVMGRSELGHILWPAHLLSEVSPLVFIRRSELGLILWPAHLLSKVSPSFIGGRIVLHLRCFKVAPKVFTTMWTIGEITATDYIER
jgi:hypothetical protein